MIPVKQLLTEVITSLRNVIAPAVADPYPKAQAYMAAVILEFLARQLDERSDIGEAKEARLGSLYEELSQLAGMGRIVGGEPPSEAALCSLIERLYGERERLGEEGFTAANHLVRATLRNLLDQDLKIAGKVEA